MGRFTNIKPGDLIEMPKSRDWLSKEIDVDDGAPARIGRIAHRWRDPHERVDYVSVDRFCGYNNIGAEIWVERSEKRTIRGLAQAGWFPARQDYISTIPAAKLEADKMLSDILGA